MPDEVPILTVDQLLDQATETFKARYAADNGENPSEEQVAEFRAAVLGHAVEMNRVALAEFEANRKPADDAEKN